MTVGPLMGQTRSGIGTVNSPYGSRQEVSILSSDSSAGHVTGAEDIEKYHAAGEKMEKVLSDPQSGKDDLLPEKEFTIERSLDIKINYRPAAVRPTTKQEKPL